MAEASDPKKMLDQADVLEDCERFESELAELRASWEQYFLGLDKRPPTDRYNALKRHAQQLKGLWVRQTAAKFRVQAVLQKFATYDRLWQRTLQEMENGTYRRDVYKARHRKPAETAPAKQTTAAQAEDQAPDVSPAEADALLSDAFDGLDAVKPLGAPLPAPARSARPAPSSNGSNGSNGSIPETRLRAVYDAYLTARKRCNEDVSRMSFEQVATMLRKQVPELMKKHNAKAVDFKVVIRDGKAVLRAVPKEG
jgi:hypothetical protein